MIEASKLRAGMTFVTNDGKLIKVLEASHHKPGKGNTIMRMKLRDVRSGSTFDTRKQYMRNVMNGIINVYKEKGYTSHDVVAKLRGILHMKKIGHTGTLDPEAEGVLPVCLGKATGLCSMITDWGKNV